MATREIKRKRKLYWQAVSGCYPDAIRLLGQSPKPQDQHYVLAAHFGKMLITGVPQQ